MPQIRRPRLRTSKNAKAMASKENKNKEVNRLLGVEELQGRERLGLSKDRAG